MHDDEQREIGLLEMCEPPPGYEFRRGLWCTHNLSMKVVTDLIAPELLGAESRIGERRRQEAAARVAAMKDRPDLVIIHAAGMYAPGPAFPDLIHPVAFGGKRRLHAKFAVLQFDKIEGKGSKTRAFLTSANLTDGGVRDNREVLVWEEVGRKHSKTLCRDLLLLFKALADELPKERESDKERIEAVREEIGLNGLTGAKKLSVVVDSLRDVKPMTSALPPVKRPARVVIVSPAFGADGNDKPARLLDPYLEGKPAVDVYLGAECEPKAAVAPQFSRAAYDHLRGRARKLRLMVVPERLPAPDGGDGKPVRPGRLHAKLIAVVDQQGTAHVLVGSANFTERGLGGRNREAMIYEARPVAWLDHLLEGLNATEWPGEPVEPASMDNFEGEIPQAQIVTARFEAAPGVDGSDPVWRGTLRMTWQTPPDRIVYRRRSGEEEVLVISKEVMFKLDPRFAALDIYHGERRYTVHIGIAGSNAGRALWAMPAHDDEARPDHGLWKLLSDLRRPQRAAPPDDDGTKRRGGKRPDGFFLPLEQRLIHLVRQRQKLNRQLNGKDASDLLEEYLQGSTHPSPLAVETGRAVLSAYLDGAPRPKDRLLQTLVDCIEHFSTERGQQHE